MKIFKSKTMLCPHNIVFFIGLIFAITGNISRASTDTSKTIVFHFRLMEEIAPPAWRQTQKAFEAAEKCGAKYIILHLNTYGGLVDAADSIRTKIINSKIPVIAYIDNNAASAGALIAIACDSIFMRTGSNIGAATVVTQDGAQAPDKYQAYMRATMRSTAESHGKRTVIIGDDTTEIWFRDPRVAEAMVDASIYIPGIIDSGKVITFTASEAIANNYCEGMAENIEEVISKMGTENYVIQEYTPTTLDDIINFLINPVIQGLLIMLIIGGIYFELQTPGIGFPLVAAIIGALLYFAPLYLEGLAEHWEILLFIAGVGLLAIEIFAIPGFGVTGISGIILIFTGLILSMIDNIVFTYEGHGLPEVSKALAIVGGSSLISFVLSIFLARKLITSRAFPNFALSSVQDKSEGFVGVDASLINITGKEGIAATTLRPSGKIEVDNEIYDAASDSGYIEKGEKIIVVKFETGQLYVRKKV